MKSCAKTKKLKELTEEIEAFNIDIDLALKTKEVLLNCYEFNGYSKRLFKITILHLCRNFYYPVPEQLTTEFDLETAIKIASELAERGIQIKSNLEILHKRIYIKIVNCSLRP